MSRASLARILALAFATVPCTPRGTLLAQEPATTTPRVATHRPADPSRHRSGTVTVAGVRIEYLDWGGAGPALVFLPGFGNSAHVFDTFAPRFTDRYRVVGVSRVGYGGSGQPQRDGYTLAERVEQLRAVLDTLGLQRAVLAGHSLGGDEITAFATRYPERTAGLIYLDAALDHVGALKVEAALGPLFQYAPEPTPADLANAAGYRGFLRRMQGVELPLGEVLQGVELPLGEVLATTRFDSAGAVRGPRTPERVAQAIVGQTAFLDYTGVRAPALALYADKKAGDMLPFLAADSAANARATAVLDSIRPWETGERARFAREVPRARVVAFPSHHYQFLSHPAETERLMREFLATVAL
jgi:pimeloyl-ACP methyl ester carboxylesterase